MFSSTLYSRFALASSQETWKNLAPKGREEYDWAVSNHVHTFAGQFIGQDFSVFLVLITFSLSLQKCLQIAVCFLYLYPLEQCAPSKCSLISLFWTFERKKFGLTCFPRMCFLGLIYYDQEPLRLLNVIEDNCYFLVVHRKLSTRCKIFSL